MELAVQGLVVQHLLSDVFYAESSRQCRPPHRDRWNGRLGSGLQNTVGSFQQVSWDRSVSMPYLKALFQAAAYFDTHLLPPKVTYDASLEAETIWGSVLFNLVSLYTSARSILNSPVWFAHIQRWDLPHLGICPELWQMVGNKWPYISTSGCEISKVEQKMQSLGEWETRRCIRILAFGPDQADSFRKSSTVSVELILLDHAGSTVSLS